jgi:hypothetical protein
MGTVGAAPIRHPEDIDLPADEQKIDEVFSGLNSDGARAFVNEIIEAVQQAHDLGDLRPVQNVIEAWYRSLLFARDPDFPSALEAARDAEPGHARIYSAEELREALGR